MDPQKKKLLLLAGVGLVVLYLFSRSKSSGATNPKVQAARDPLQQAAQQLGLQRQQQQANLQASADQVAANEANTLSQFTFFKGLAADPAYACPGGGLPRWIPGQGPGCIAHQSKSFLQQAAELFGGVVSGYRVFQGIPGLGGSPAKPPTAPSYPPAAQGRDADVRTASF